MAAPTKVWGITPKTHAKTAIAFQALFNSVVYQKSVWMNAAHRRYSDDFKTAGQVWIPVNATNLATAALRLQKAGKIGAPKAAMEFGAISDRYLTAGAGTAIDKFQHEFKLDSHIEVTLDISRDNMAQARADVIRPQMEDEADRISKLIDHRIAMEVIATAHYDTASGKTRAGLGQTVTLSAGVDDQFDFSTGISLDAGKKIVNTFLMMESLLQAQGLLNPTAESPYSMGAFMRHETSAAMHQAIINNGYRFERSAEGIMSTGYQGTLFGIPIFLDSKEMPMETTAVVAADTYGIHAVTTAAGTVTIPNIPKSTSDTTSTYIYFVPILDRATVAYAEYARTGDGGVLLAPQWDGGNSYYKDAWQWDYLADIGAKQQDPTKLYRIKVGGA